MFSFSRNIIFLLSLGMVLGILFVGLYPFSYSPSNQVTRLDNGNGIRFFGRGEGVSVEDTVWPHTGYTGQPITLELHLKPLRSYHEEVPHILSLCDRSGREILYLGQWKNHLVMRLLGDSRWFTRVEGERGTPDFLNPGKLVSLTFVFSADRVDLYADGTLAENYDGFDLIGTIDHRPVRSIVLGNSSGGDSPWEGEIHGFSVFSKALDPIAILDRHRQWESGEKDTVADEVIHYRFNTPLGRAIRNEAGTKWDLLIPEALTPLRREYLALPSRQDLGKAWFYIDALVNLIGFVPLGLILSLLFYTPDDRRRSRLIVLSFTAGFFLSIFIEINQGFLVTRTSSLTDLGLNSLGTMIGALVFSFFSRTSTPGISP
jgi:VanZ family protein